MASEQFANDAQTTLNAGIDDSTTTITVASASAFPSQPQFRIRIEGELLLVTAGTGTTTWIVERGIEGTTPAAHDECSVVTQVLTAGAISSLRPNACCVPYALLIQTTRAPDGDSDQILATIPVASRTVVAYNGTITGMTSVGYPLSFTVAITAWNTVEDGMVARMNILNLIDEHHTGIGIDVTEGTDSFDIVADGFSTCQSVAWSLCLQGNTCAIGGPVPDDSCGPIPASLSVLVIICGDAGGHEICNEQECELCVTYDESTGHWVGSETFTLIDCDDVEFAFPFSLEFWVDEDDVYQVTSTLFNGSMTDCPIDGNPFTCQVESDGCSGSIPCELIATVTICANEVDGHTMDDSQTFRMCLAHDDDSDRWTGSGTFTLTDADANDFAYDFEAMFWYASGVYYMQSSLFTSTLTDCPVDGTPFSQDIYVAGYGNVPAKLKATVAIDSLALDCFVRETCLEYSGGRWYAQVAPDCVSVDGSCPTTVDIWLTFDTDTSKWIMSFSPSFDDAAPSDTPDGDYEGFLPMGGHFCGKDDASCQVSVEIMDCQTGIETCPPYSSSSIALTTPDCSEPLVCNHYEIYLTTP